MGKVKVNQLDSISKKKIQNSPIFFMDYTIEKYRKFMELDSMEDALVELSELATRVEDSHPSEIAEDRELWEVYEPVRITFVVGIDPAPDHKPTCLGIVLKES